MYKYVQIYVQELDMMGMVSIAVVHLQYIVNLQYLLYIDLRA